MLHSTSLQCWTCVLCSSQSMAVHGSGNSMMVHNSGPSMSVAHAGGGANMVGPLQDKLNRLLLNANSPAKSSGHGSLIAAGRYDNLSASLSQSVKVSLSMQTCHPICTDGPEPSWHLQAGGCMLMMRPSNMQCCWHTARSWCEAASCRSRSASV